MAVALVGPVKSAPLNFAASGDNIVVAASGTQRISVIGLSLVAAGATNLTFKDGANLLSGAMPLAANGSIVLDAQPGLDWYSTSNVANNFIINSSAAVQVSGTIYYVQA